MFLRLKIINSTLLLGSEIEPKTQDFSRVIPLTLRRGVSFQACAWLVLYPPNILSSICPYLISTAKHQYNKELQKKNRGLPRSFERYWCCIMLVFQQWLPLFPHRILAGYLIIRISGSMCGYMIIDLIIWTWEHV